MIYTVTMGHVPARIWRQSVQAYYALAERKTEHVFVDCHYALNEKSNREQLWKICCEYGISVLDPGVNLGGAEAFNYALRRLPLRPDDVVIGFDPDSAPISPGFDGAIAHVLTMDPKVNWVSLMSPRAKPELVERGFTKRMVGHVEVWKTHNPVVNSVCGFRAGWLQSIGGLRQPSPYYGGLEVGLFSELRGGEWVFLPGWEESDIFRNMQDEQYLWWKWRLAHLRDWHTDFKSYVEAGCPPPSDLPQRLP